MHASGCFFVPLMASIGRLLIDCKIATDMRTESIYDAPNDNLKSQNSGNEMEVFAAAIVSESSRRPHFPNRKFTFAGQDGIEFVKNVLLHSNLWGRFSVTEATQVSVTFPPALERFLKRLLVPFIYGWNRRIEFLDRLSASTPDFFAASLERCRNADEIDARFPIRVNRKDLSATLECKHYANNVTAGHLNAILQKALLHPSSPLSLIFTLKAVERTNCTAKEKNQDQANQNALLLLCTSRRINLFRVKRLGGFLEYEFVPFDKTIVYSNPNLTCLLIDFDSISFSR